MLSKNKIKTVLLKYSIIRWLLSPYRKANYAIKNKRLKTKVEVYEHLKRHLVNDPVMKVDEFQGTFSMSSNSDLFKRLILNEKYEPELVNTCLKYLDRDRDVIDVGANIGFYSIMFAKELNGPHKVLSIEPTKKALSRLYKNIENNDVSEVVTVYEGVASNESGTVQIKTISGKEEYSSIGEMSHPAISGEQFVKENVSSTTIDELVERYSINPGFIKIDVEGAEKQVFEGALDTLRSKRPIILSEFSDYLLKKNGSSADDILALLKELNYYIVDPIEPYITAGSKDFGDILCFPSEMNVSYP